MVFIVVLTDQHKICQKHMPQQLIQVIWRVKFIYKSIILCIIQQAHTFAMTSIPRQSFKAELLPLLKKQLNLAKKVELKTALQKITSKTANSSSTKVQLIDEIANELYPLILNYKTDIDGVNRVLEYLKNWFRTELGHILKSITIDGFDTLFKKEFKGIDIGKPRATKFNQILVQNLWTDQRSNDYICICPKAPSNLAGEKPSQKCYICGVNFHMECLWGRAKQQKSNTVLNECPSCFLTNCITHKHVEKVLFAGYLPTTKSNKLQFHINFQFPAQLKSSAKISLQARCIRLKPQADYNRYEITWPDNSILHFNNRRVTDFKLMSINSAVKRRGDEQVVLDKGNAYCDGSESLVIEQKHQYDSFQNKYDFASHFVMVMAVRQETDDQLLNKFNNKRLTIPESKAILKNYLNSNSSSDIQVEKFSISLRCPMYFTKITIPVRSKHCSSHFQPFDLKNFLTINRNLGKGLAQKYKCPICKRRAYDLVIDDYLEDLISSQNNRENATEITFRADGEPHFEEEVVDGSSDDEILKPQQNAEKLQSNDSDKIVEEFNAIDIDIQGQVQPENTQLGLTQESINITQKHLQSNSIKDEWKITSLIQPNKPVIFGDNKTSIIFDQIENKQKIPKMFQSSNFAKKNQLRGLLGEILSDKVNKNLVNIIGNDKNQTEKVQQQKDKNVQQKKQNDEKVNVNEKAITNQLQKVNNLPQKPVHQMTKNNSTQQNKQNQLIQKESLMQVQLPSNNIGAHVNYTTQNPTNFNGQIIEGKANPKMRENQLISSTLPLDKLPEMIEISSDDENVQKETQIREKKPEPKFRTQNKKKGKEQLKHHLYTIQGNNIKKSKTGPQSPPANKSRKASKPKSRSRIQRRVQKSEEEEDYDYQYNLSDQQSDCQGNQIYEGQSEQSQSQQPGKKRNFIKEINNHMYQMGRKRVKLDDERVNARSEPQIQCIELLSEDEQAIYQQPAEHCSLNPITDQEDEKIQLEGENQQLNGSQTILEEEVAETKRNRYHTEVGQLRRELEDLRKIMEKKHSRDNRTLYIKEDDEKLFFDIIQETNQDNNEPIFYLQ